MIWKIGESQRHASSKRIVGALLFSFAALFVCNLPDHPDAVSVDAFARLPLEWPFIAIIVLVTRGRLRRLLISLFSLVVFLLLFLKVADIGVQSAFQRPFNPYLDVKMMRDGWNLISGTIGNPAAAAALTSGIFIIMLVATAFLKSLVWLSEAQSRLRRRLLWIFAALFMIGGVLLLFGQQRVNFATPAYLSARLALVVRSVEDMRAFEKEIEVGRGPVRGNGLFGAVKGKDVILIFVESYGRSAVEDETYRAVTQARLAAMDRQIDAAGLHAASGWVTSPTVGGLSWLAHGTLLSGLWVDSQFRYDRLMISHQPSLNRLFSQSGWHSVAVMPAITMAWPEASYFGYDQILPASGLEYRGKPFNWVTMPDQYTLSAFNRLALQPAHARGQNVMAEIALVSSHAPWTPVPKLIDWNDIGDGSVFDAQAMNGDPPAVVWADPDRVRRQYIQTIDYSLATLGEFMARQGRQAVYIILGDHQPASIITGSGASRAVPVHIVSSDQQTLARFQSQGFVSGMKPSGSLKELPMNDLRQILIDAFSSTEQ